MMRLPREATVVGFLTAIAAPSVGVQALRPAAAVQSEPAEQGPKRILVLYDENKDDLPGLSRTDRSLREAFQAGLGALPAPSRCSRCPERLSISF